jgi:hypothetical protein
MDRRSPETEALRTEMEGAVAQAVMQLPETQREVLILAHFEQLSLAEIAQVLEIEEPAVRSRRLSHERYGCTWSAQPLGTGRYLFAVRSRPIGAQRGGPHRAQRSRAAQDCRRLAVRWR